MTSAHRLGFAAAILAALGVTAGPAAAAPATPDVDASLARLDELYRSKSNRCKAYRCP